MQLLSRKITTVSDHYLVIPHFQQTYIEHLLSARHCLLPLSVYTCGECVCVLDGVVREGLSDKSTCVQRPERSERMSHEDVESEGTASANALG